MHGLNRRDAVIRDGVFLTLTGEKSMNNRIRNSVIVVVAMVACAAGYYAWQMNQPAPPLPSPQVVQPQPATPIPEAAPAKNYPIESPPPAATPLPALDASDKVVGDELAKLLGRKSLPRFLYPNRIIRRFVATIDNLPRRHAPVRMWPVKPVSGTFTVTDSSTGLVIDLANSFRYARYIDVLKAADVPGLVDFYFRFFPLFQQAYQELGYPQGNFNNRLIEALDDLLDAPEVSGPVGLVQPKVLYAFADPALEARSAGQKIMIRMGSRNSAQAKVALRAIRSEIMRRVSVK